MTIAKVTALVPNAKLGDVLAFLHAQKIANVDVKFEEGGEKAKPNGHMMRQLPPQHEFFRQLMRGFKNGLNYEAAKQAWASAGYSPPSFWAALSHAQEKKVIKRRGDKIFPGGKP